MQSPLIKKLRKVAPWVACSVSWEEDPFFQWDGDGPDPADDGYAAYDVDVSAAAVVDGEDVRGRASLGGSYSKPPHDPDVHGYLNQLLDEAFAELAGHVQKDAALSRQVKNARALLKREREKAYKKQRQQMKRKK